MAQVKFVAATLAKYLAVEAKDANTLYFIPDAGKIYKGGDDVTEAVQLVSTFAEKPDATIVEGKFYLNAQTLEMRVKSGEDWVIVSPGYITTEAEFTTANGSKLANIAATKAYIATEIGKITGGEAFVRNLTWDNETGKITVDKGEEVPGKMELTGVAHDAVYDATNLKLTIPVYGGTDVVVNIPKDKFVHSGRYEAEYDLPDGTKGPAIVLVIDDDEDPTEGTREVVIPAASLVKTHTGGATDSATITISDANVVTAVVNIDPTANNAIEVVTGKGLRVDISGKANKLTAAAENKVLVGSADGDLAASTVEIATTGDMGDSDDVLPTASVIAAAIAAAVSAAQTTLQNQIDTHDNRLDLIDLDLAELRVGSGDANKVIVSTATGIERSTVSIGGATIDEATANVNTLATEKAVINAISWTTL